MATSEGKIHVIRRQENSPSFDPKEITNEVLSTVRGCREFLEAYRACMNATFSEVYTKLDNMEAEARALASKRPN